MTSRSFRKLLLHKSVIIIIMGSATAFAHNSPRSINPGLMDNPPFVSDAGIKQDTRMAENTKREGLAYTKRVRIVSTAVSGSSQAQETTEEDINNSSSGKESGAVNGFIDYMQMTSGQTATGRKPASKRSCTKPKPKRIAR